MAGSLCADPETKKSRPGKAARWGCWNFYYFYYVPVYCCCSGDGLCCCFGYYYGYVAVILLQLPCQSGGVVHSFLQNVRGPGKSVTQHTKKSTIALTRANHFGSVSWIGGDVCKKVRQCVAASCVTYVTVQLIYLYKIESCCLLQAVKSADIVARAGDQAHPPRATASARCWWLEESGSSAIPYSARKSGCLSPQ